VFIHVPTPTMVMTLIQSSARPGISLMPYLVVLASVFAAICGDFSGQIPISYLFLKACLILVYLVGVISNTVMCMLSSEALSDPRNLLACYV
jgi:hypothetical protein